ncbi:hypothetical protein AKJ16_DCAP12233 [Drosera capensis]
MPRRPPPQITQPRSPAQVPDARRPALPPAARLPPPRSPAGLCPNAHSRSFNSHFPKSQILRDMDLSFVRHVCGGLDLFDVFCCFVMVLSQLGCKEQLRVAGTKAQYTWDPSLDREVCAVREDTLKRCFQDIFYKARIALIKESAIAMQNRAKKNARHTQSSVSSVVIGKRMVSDFKYYTAIYRLPPFSFLKQVSLKSDLPVLNYIWQALPRQISTGFEVYSHDTGEVWSIDKRITIRVS